MMQDIERVMISEEELRRRIRELGKQITEDYAGKVPVFVGVLRGVIIFFADMIRTVELPCELDLISVSSYGSGTVTSGEVVLKKDVSLDLEGRDVIILEDIIDTGLTLRWTVDHLLKKHPASLKICALLDKPERREVEICADYIGFTIPNEFVVGFGLDYDDRYRNLPFVGVLKPEVYNKAGQ